MHSNTFASKYKGSHLARLQNLLADSAPNLVFAGFCVSLGVSFQGKIRRILDAFLTVCDLT